MAMMLNEGKINNYLKEANSFLLSKKDGVVCPMEETRCIQLLPHATKIMEKAIYQKLVQSGIFDTGPYQTGFKIGSSCGHAQAQVIQKICADTLKRKKGRRVYCFIDVAKAFDSVDRTKLFRILDERILKAKQKANEASDINLLEKLEMAQKALTPLKDMYDGHKLITGTESFETTNGVIQGAVNSPQLFAVYLEEYLFKDPIIKNFCEFKNLLAFADDMVLICNSYSELRDVLKRLTIVLREAGLEINIKKSEILSTRNANLPENGDWQTDDEDTHPIVKHYRESSEPYVHRKGAKENPIALDSAPMEIDQQAEAAPKTRIDHKVICGMKIVEKFKYLGLELGSTKAEIEKNARTQVQKYVSIVHGKVNTGDEGCNNAVVSAYARSLFLFMMPPLVANNILGCDETT